MLHKGDPRCELYAMFSKQLEVNGQPFFRIDADELTFDVHFLRMRLASPEDLRGLILWIPREHVAFACADAQDRKIGFLNS